jgi:para-aminobenzoate synthetase/4-amino-4-deoxychorismate lyase
MFPEPDKTNYVVAQDAKNQRWLYFSDPVKIVSTTETSQVKRVLADVEYECRNNGLYAAGYLGYEAARAFDSSFSVKTGGDLPLIWFGIYKLARVIPFPDVDSIKSEFIEPLDWNLLLSEDEYRGSVDRVKDYIRNGDTYQVNYSFRLRADCQNSGWPLFVNMVHAQNLAQQRGYSVFVETPDWTICSASPELFFHYDGGTLKSMPMKGTAPRGLGFEDDIAAGIALQKSEKNRAENIMIADMVRNDMGRIARTGSVVTTDVLSVEKYPTFWTMTTTVNCEVGPSLMDIFEAMFPAASITGAPKVRATQIIDELESQPRNIYTGAAGFIGSDDTAQFNVAIRTVLVDKRKGQAEFGVGGAIVWDSETGDEFEECHTKARVLTYLAPDFDLIETLKWDLENGYLYIEEHVRRLENSAYYFSWNMDSEKVWAALDNAVPDFGNTPQRVRLQLSANGLIKVEFSEFVSLSDPYRVRLAQKAVNSRNYFLYHKTTNRSVYENAMDAAADQGCDDVLLWNERGEITESCRANILIDINGRRITPPLSSGLLNGIGRQVLLDLGTIEEQLITVDMLEQADSIWLVNSVRDRWRVVLEN